MIYIILLAYILLVGLFLYVPTIKYDNQYLSARQKDRLFLVLSFSFLILLMGLRDQSVGVDTKAYEAFYRSVVGCRFHNLLDGYYTNIGNVDIECGFALLAKICTYISEDYYFFQMVVAICFCSFTAHFILNNSNDALFSTIIFLGMGIYLSSFNVARQWLATAIVMNGWSAVRRSKVKGWILLALGSTIHFCGLIVAFATLINLMRNNKVFLRLVPVVSLVIALNYQQVMMFLQPYMPSKFDVYYANLGTLQQQRLNYITWAIIFFLMICYLIPKNKVQVQHKYYAILSCIYVTCEIIGLSFSKVERVGWPFMYFVILLFPSVTCYLNDKWSKRYRFAMLVFYSFLFIHRALNTEEFRYITWIGR